MAKDLTHRNRARAERDKSGIPLPRRYLEQLETDLLPRAAPLPVSSLRLGRLPDSGAPVQLKSLLGHAQRIQQPYIHYPPLVARRVVEAGGDFRYDLLSPEARLHDLTEGTRRSRVRVYIADLLTDGDARVLGLAEWCRLGWRDRTVLKSAWALVALRDTLRAASVDSAYSVLMRLTGLAKSTVSTYIRIGDGLSRDAVDHIVAETGIHRGDILNLSRDVLVRVAHQAEAARVHFVRSAMASPGSPLR